MKETAAQESTSFSLDLISGKLKAYAELLKFRLTLTVVFSGAVGYLLAERSSINFSHLFIFIAGSFLMTVASNVINQIFEKETDKLMKRTAGRPLPTDRISVNEAIMFAGLTSMIGFALLLFYINELTAVLTFISLLLYGFAYTPLKTRSSVAVFVGAIPGALPPLIGWIAVSNSFSIEGWLLFGIQFFWQFPHFWAIAWVLDEDYKKAGIRLLPVNGGQDLNTAFQIMIYTLMLIPLGLVPAKLGITGINSAIIATVCGVLFLMQTFYLMKTCTREAALKIMFGSFLYLPVVQISFVLDKIVK